MQVKRSLLNLRHNVAFNACAVAFSTRSENLLELLVEGVRSSFSLASRDVSLRSGQSLDAWALRLNMFNGLGSVELTIDGLNASYQRLGTDGDLAVVLDLQQRIMTAIANHTPSVKALTESVSGTMVFEVLGGTADRAQYFGGVGFPGRSPMHQDVGFKSRVLHPNVDAIASIEVSPVWTNDHEIFVAFEVDTIRLDSLSFIERGRTAIELIQIALASFDLGGVI